MVGLSPQKNAPVACNFLVKNSINLGRDSSGATSLRSGVNWDHHWLKPKKLVTQKIGLLQNRVSQKKHCLKPILSFFPTCLGPSIAVKPSVSGQTHKQIVIIYKFIHKHLQSVVKLHPALHNIIAIYTVYASLVSHAFPILNVPTSMKHPFLSEHS